METIRELARLTPDRGITAFLNRARKRTGKGNTWTESRVRAFRTNHDIPVYREGERQARNELTQAEAAARLNVSARTVNGLIRTGAVAARQACKGAPWVIPADALEALNDGASPPASDPRQETLDFERRTEVPWYDPDPLIGVRGACRRSAPVKACVRKWAH